METTLDFICCKIHLIYFAKQHGFTDATINVRKLFYVKKTLYNLLKPSTGCYVF